MNNSAGYSLLSSAILSPSGANDLRKHTKIRQYLTDPEKHAFDVIVEFLTKHGKLPEMDTVKVDMGILLPKAPEPVAFYVDKVFDRHKSTTMKWILERGADIINQSKDHDGALAFVYEQAQQLKRAELGSDMINFTESALDLYKQSHYEKHHPGFGRLPMGWPSLDMGDGSISAGDVLVIVGRPASGKTYLSLYGAINAWLSGMSVLFVSMEIKALALIERMIAMLTKTPVTHIKQGAVTTKSKQVIYNVLSGIQSSENLPGFYVVDGNLSSTVSDVATMASYGDIEAVFVDGAYMLQPSNPRISRWERVTDTVEDVKRRIAGDLNVPVVLSYQFNREQTKVKATDDTGLEHIGGADAIAQIASVVIGVHSDDSVESLNQKKIRVMKGRDGQVGEYSINWVFDTFPFMNFSEIDPPQYDLHEGDDVDSQYHSLPELTKLKEAFHESLTESGLSLTNPDGTMKYI